MIQAVTQFGWNKDVDHMRPYLSHSGHRSFQLKPSTGFKRISTEEKIKILVTEVKETSRIMKEELRE